MAEVLITLTIVGVIAALTIPNLMSKYQEHAWHQQWKDDYALINNAFKMVVMEEPDLNINPTPGYKMGMSQEFINALLSHLQVVDTCKVTSTCNSKKWAAHHPMAAGKLYKTLGGDVYGHWDNSNAALLKNGAAIYFGGLHMLTIVIDVNNFSKGPNVVGKDVYGITFSGTKYYGDTAIVNEAKMIPFTSNDSGVARCEVYSTGNTDQFRLAPGAGCSYKYLYEK